MVRGLLGKKLWEFTSNFETQRFRKTKQDKKYASSSARSPSLPEVDAELPDVVLEVERDVWGRENEETEECSENKQQEGDAIETQDDAVPESEPMARTAELLARSRHKLLNSLEATAEQLKISRRTLTRYINAVAEISWRHQQKILGSLVTYLQTLAERNHIQPLLVLHHIKYDETPMRVIESAGQDHLSIEGAEQPCELSFEQRLTKVFVVEHSWTILCHWGSLNVHSPEFGPNCVAFQGSFSPAIRASSRGTAENIQEVLKRVWNVPDELSRLGRTHWRLVETDENGANTKAEKLIAEGDERLCALQVTCLAHKCHSIAAKSWSSYPQLHRSIISTLKVLTGGRMHSFMQHLMHEVDQRLVIGSLSGPLDDEAVLYRNHILQIFAPSVAETARGSAHIRKGAIELLNGDWRQPHVTHRCTHCCVDRADTASKIKRWLGQAVKDLTLKQLNKDDWRQWHRSLHLVGFLSSVHSLFPAAFAAMCASVMPPATANDVACESAPAVDLDKTEAWRQELRKNTRMALEFWNGDRPHTDLFIFRTCISPQTTLMQKMLANASGKWDVLNRSQAGQL